MARKFLKIALVFVVVALAGCQTTTDYYLGARANGGTIVRIPATDESGLHWQDLYLSVDYALVRQGDRLTLSGSFTFANSPRFVYKRVSDMKVKLFLLDAANRVVAYRDVGRTLSHDLEDDTRIKGEFTLPVSAVAYTFGYEGTFIGDEEDGFHVWKLPQRD